MPGDAAKLRPTTSPTVILLGGAAIAGKAKIHFGLCKSLASHTFDLPLDLEVRSGDSLGRIAGRGG